MCGGAVFIEKPCRCGHENTGAQRRNARTAIACPAQGITQGGWNAFLYAPPTWNDNQIRVIETFQPVRGCDLKKTFPS
jgi:hypothetical protein